MLNQSRFGMTADFDFGSVFFPAIQGEQIRTYTNLKPLLQLPELSACMEQTSFRATRHAAASMPGCAPSGLPWLHEGRKWPPWGQELLDASAPVAIDSAWPACMHTTGLHTESFEYGACPGIVRFTRHL